MIVLTTMAITLALLGIGSICWGALHLDEAFLHPYADECRHAIRGIKLITVGTMMITAALALA